VFAEFGQLDQSGRASFAIFFRRIPATLVAVARPSRNPLAGEDIQRFLHSFEGAAATFDRSDERWTLWLPEMTAGDHPLTPASQVYFPVILRHGAQAIAIRFLYDCSSGKVRYHTSAVPPEIVELPEFENAVSELFRHSLPVEPIRARKLGRGEGRAAKSGKGRREESLAEPAGALVPAASKPLVSLAAKPLVSLAPKPAVPVKTSAPVEPAATVPAQAIPPVHRTVRLDVGPDMRAVLMAFIVTTGLVILAGLGIHAYLQANQDPGVLHHKLQIEEMRARQGR
jgi:hypothetical protein